jgi:cob(I)alamin adenosyltransferase
MTIYTKRGDKGKTGLYDEASTQRERVSKDTLRIRAIGAVDELNSFLGLAISFSEDQKLNTQLKEIQRDLFTIGSILAGSKLRFFKTKTKRLEKVIDKLEGDLPVLRNFVLPGGSQVASHLQFARALARRAEREVVSLSVLEPVKPRILMYLNRLSDYLFMLARDVNKKTGVKEEVWVGRKK